MPAAVLIAFGVGLVAGGTGGFLVGEGLSSLSRLGLVVVAGGAVFVAAKGLKVV